jgi:coproporphyrinogen III oxidase-like Fe-S oxidoreductase
VETVMLALRTDKGIDADFLHGNCSMEDIGSLVKNGALVREGDRYRIPEDHFFVSDEIIRELI